MERTKTLEISSKEEQTKVFKEKTASMLAETLSITDFVKTLTKSMEQKIKKMLLRYVPKDTIDPETASISAVLKAVLKDKPMSNMLFERLVNFLWCNVKICELTKDSLKKLEMLYDAWSWAVWL